MSITIKCPKCGDDKNMMTMAGTCVVCGSELYPTGTESEVCKDIALRQSSGVKKYGQTVSGNPLTLKQWLQHAYEECLDQAVYLKRAIQEIEKTEPEKFINPKCVLCDEKATQTAMQVPVCDNHRKEYDDEGQLYLPDHQRPFKARLLAIARPSK